MDLVTVVWFATVAGGAYVVGSWISRRFDPERELARLEKKALEARQIDAREWVKNRKRVNEVAARLVSRRYDV